MLAAYVPTSVHAYELQVIVAPEALQTIGEVGQEVKYAPTGGSVYIVNDSDLRAMNSIPVVRRVTRFLLSELEDFHDSCKKFSFGLKNSHV